MEWIDGKTITSYTIVRIWPNIRLIYGSQVNITSTHGKNQNTLK
jgi:hypothetical protein